MKTSDDFSDIFGKYGRFLEVNYDIETIPISGFNSNYMAVYGKSDITAKVHFYGSISVDSFVADLATAQQEEKDKQIRERNPTVMRAWEDYQLLLKLAC